MPDLTPMSEDGLRAAMRDPRYWQSGHPERAAYSAWVTQGFEALEKDGGASGGVVHVSAYTRDGHTVAAHTRSSPPRSDVGTNVKAGEEVRPGPLADTELREQCARQAEADEGRCRRIPARNRVARAMCWGSVQARYAACIASRSLPPLLGQ